MKRAAFRTVPGRNEQALSRSTEPDQEQEATFQNFASQFHLFFLPPKPKQTQAIYIFLLFTILEKEDQI
jgi:hypothetical protein